MRYTALVVGFGLVLGTGCGEKEVDKQPKVTIDPSKQRTFEIEGVAAPGGGTKGPAPLQPAQRDKEGK